MARGLDAKIACGWSGAIRKTGPLPLHGWPQLGESGQGSASRNSGQERTMGTEALGICRHLGGRALGFPQVVGERQAPNL